jgi:uncharacterized protein (AIM24 family)
LPDCQILTVNLKTGERVECEPGSMMFMSPNIKSSVECGNCSRLCAGEGLFKSVYSNPDSLNGFVSMTPNFPAKVVPVDLGKYGKIVTKSGAYMGSIGDVSVKVDCDFNCCTACFGGMGCTRQSAEGSGTVFLAAGGTILSKTLAVKETIVVDEASLVAFQDTAKKSLRTAGKCCSCTWCCGGEGMFVTTIEGPGVVIIQSMSFEKYKQAVVPSSTAANMPQA